MSNEGHFEYVAGEGSLFAEVRIGFTIWDGSAYVEADTIADADWTDGQIEAVEEVSSDDTGTGHYFFDLPNGSPAGLYAARAYLSTARAVDDISVTAQDIEYNGTTVVGPGNANVAAIDGDSTAAGNLKASTLAILQCAVDTVVNTHTPTTTELQSDSVTEATADHYIGRVMIFTSGNLEDQATNITGYARVGGIGQFTVAALTEAPANNDTFLIL